MKYFFVLVVGMILVLVSCTKEEDENPLFKITPKGAVASIANVSGFFDLLSPSTSSVSFDVSTKGEAVSSIEIFKSVKGGAEASLASITSFPTTVSVSFNDALSGTGLTLDDLAPGDKAEFRMVINTASGSYPGGSVTFDMTCPSDLAGMMDVITVGWCGEEYTGTAEMVKTGPGTYTFTDMSFGAYEVCYGAGSTLPEGTLEIVDICNMLSYSGLSQWGEIYEFLSMTVDGPSLIFAWKNSYDPEAGTTTLVRQDGKDWPALSF